MIILVEKGSKGERKSYLACEDQEVVEKFKENTPLFSYQETNKLPEKLMMKMKPLTMKILNEVIQSHPKEVNYKLWSENFIIDK